MKQTYSSIMEVCCTQFWKSVIFFSSNHICVFLLELVFKNYKQAGHYNLIYLLKKTKLMFVDKQRSKNNTDKRYRYEYKENGHGSVYDTDTEWGFSRWS